MYLYVCVCVCVCVYLERGVREVEGESFAWREETTFKEMAEYTVTYSTANMCNNCAFHDKSMKLRTVLKHYIKRSFVYSDITDMPCK